MVRVPVGGTNKKLRARLLRTAASTDGHSPPSKRGAHHHRQHQHRLGRQPVQVRRQAEPCRQQRGAENGQQVPADPAGPAHHALVPPSPAGPAGVVVGDDVHVDLTGAGDHLLPHTGLQQRRHPAAAAGPDQHLAGVDSAGHIEQPVGGVVGDDGLEGAAHLLGGRAEPLQAPPVTLRRARPAGSRTPPPIPRRRSGWRSGQPVASRPASPARRRHRPRPAPGWASYRRSGAGPGSGPGRRRPGRPATAAPARAAQQGCLHGSSSTSAASILSAA